MQLRLRSILLSCVLLLTLCALASEARADSIVITNGSIGFDSQEVNNGFSLQGAGFSMQGHTVYFYLNDDFLPPGGTFHTGMTFANEPLFVHIPFTINGVTYNQWGSANDSLVLSFSASSFVLPTDTSLNSVSFSTAFTMDGHINLTSATNLLVGLTGQGTANVVFNVSRENAWRLSTLTYTFNQPATPTPEPTTLLLLGTGIAGVAAKVYRRRKERK